MTTTGVRTLFGVFALTMIAAARPTLAAAPGPDALSDTACFLLFIASSPGAVAGDSGQEAIRFPLPPTACNYGVCWMSQQDMDGTTKCVYGRGATLTLNRVPSAKAARRLVKAALATGYQRVNVGADLAASTPLANGITIVMAVGKTAAVLGLGPVSDIDDAPSWAGVETETINEAKVIAARLRRRGCALNYRRCSSK